MDVGPHGDITTFLLHIRRRAADNATSSSHDMTVSSADGVKATATSAIGTGDVDTEGGAPAPPSGTIIGNTNNPTGLDGTIPIGPSDDTHVANSDTAASPTLKDTTTTMQPSPEPTQRSVHTESAHPLPVTIYGPMVDSDGTVGTLTPPNADTNLPPKKKRRRSHGSGCEAGRKVFCASKEHKTTGDPENQGGADARGEDRGGRKTAVWTAPPGQCP